jgi:hypothetical protein
VTEQVADLVAATRAPLITWARTSVFDKLADAGGGGVDAYRSEHVDDFIGKVCAELLPIRKGK